MPVNRLRRAVVAATTVIALASIGPAPAARAAQSVTAAPSLASPHPGSAATLPNPLLADRGSTSVCQEYGHCLARILTVAPGSAEPLTATAPEGYGPADFAAAYRLPAGVGHGGTIAILDQGSFPTLEETLGVYRSTYGLPPCTAANGCFKQVGERGGAPLAPATTLLDQVSTRRSPSRRPWTWTWPRPPARCARSSRSRCREATASPTTSSPGTSPWR